MKKIVIKTLGDTIRVVEKPLKTGRHSCRGYWDANKGEIAIDSTLSEADKIATLIHEYMHLIDDVMIDNGVYAKRTPHKNILNIADNLFALLAMSGLIKGMKEADAITFMKNMRDEYFEENEAKSKK